MKEPKYRKAYEALEEEFVLASAVIDARSSAHAAAVRSDEAISRENIYCERGQ